MEEGLDFLRIRAAWCILPDLASRTANDRRQSVKWSNADVAWGSSEFRARPPSSMWQCRARGVPPTVPTSTICYIIPRSPLKSMSSQIWSQWWRTEGSLSPRKKACQGCTTAKVRCDLEKPSCSRCRARGKQCRCSWGSDGQDLGGPATLADSVSLDESLNFQPLTGESTAFTTAGFLSPISL